jgi:hypothetical protein
MAGKLDFERAQQEHRIAIKGHEPVSKDYVEFPSKYSNKVKGDIRPISTPEWIDGQPNPRNEAVQKKYLLHVEEAFRRGEQPNIPKNIAERLASQNDAIRMNPEVRKAYHATLTSKQQRRG